MPACEDRGTVLLCPLRSRSKLLHSCPGEEGDNPLLSGGGAALGSSVAEGHSAGTSRSCLDGERAYGFSTQCSLFSGWAVGGFGEQ